MMQQMDVFLQSETQNFVDMLFNVVESKQYVNPAQQVKEETRCAEKSRAEDEESKEPSFEADSTTPIREDEKFPDPRSVFDDRTRFRDSPPQVRRIASRLGTREIREPPRRFRSRSRSLSPRHDRFRSSRRRSRSPNNTGRRRSPGMSRRVRSSEKEPQNSRDCTPTRDEGATGILLSGFIMDAVIYSSVRLYTNCKETKVQRLR